MKKSNPTNHSTIQPFRVKNTGHNLYKLQTPTEKSDNKLHAVFTTSTEVESLKLAQVCKMLSLSALIFACTVLSFSLLSPNINTAKAESTASTSSDLTIQVAEAISLSLNECGSDLPSESVNLRITPTPTGTYGAACQKVTVDTNNPGYTLLVKASSTNANYDSGNPTNALLYQNPTTATIFPTIPAMSDTATIATPTVITNETWGFGVEDLIDSGFDTTYEVNNANNKFAEMPTTDTEVYFTDEWPLPQNSFDFYYATKLSTATTAGTYKTMVTYTAVGEEVPEPTYPLAYVVSKAKVTTMQQLTSTLCSTADYDNTNNGNNANNTVILTDTRNDQQYRVRKLADNKCWMIDNLKLATPGTDLILTSDDTDIAEGTTFTIPAAEATSISATITNWNDPSTTTACLTNTPKIYADDSLTQCGYLYNWYAATAGTGTATMASGDVTASICPIGWRLPSAGLGTATVANEFAVLNGAMIDTGPSITNNSTTYSNWQYNGSFSGTYAGRWATSFSFQGTYGYYWSSSAYSAGYARSSYFREDNITPGSGYSTGSHSISVRCLL